MHNNSVKVVAIAALAAAGIISSLLVSSYYQTGVSGQTSGQPLPTGSPQGGFTSAVNLTDNPQDSVYGQVVASGDNVYVVWQDSMTSGDQGYGRNYDIFMMRSSDSGTTFGPPVNLSNNSGFSEHPQAAAHGDSLYAVWADNTSGNREVLFAKSMDNGTTFEDAINLSSNPSDSFNQEMAVSGNGVYIIWLDEDDESSRILFKASVDGGATFGETITISDRANDMSFPKVAAYGGNVHVTWNVIDSEAENALYYAKSSDMGESFGTIKKLNSDDNFGEAQIVAHNETVYVVSGGLDVAEVNGLFFAKSTNGGEDFMSKEIDGNGTFMNPLNVEAAVDGDGLLYIAGQIAVSGNEEILLLVPNGSEPIAIANLSNNAKISECPSIAISGNNIHVVWEDMTPGNHEILYAKGSMK